MNNTINRDNAGSEAAELVVAASGAGAAAGSTEQSNPTTTVEIILAQLKHLMNEAKQAIEAAATSEEIEQLRVSFLGKKSLLNEVMQRMRDVSHDERRQVGQMLNVVKLEIEAEIGQRSTVVADLEEAQQLAAENIDVTLPGRLINPDFAVRSHPITQTINDLAKICYDLGFVLIDGPEIESELYNFDLLNIPAQHPARQMQDTMYIAERRSARAQGVDANAAAGGAVSNTEEEGAAGDASGLLLRTHTSAVQVKYGMRHHPPLRIASIGRVYRADALDQTHSPMFHQMEMMCIDRRVSVAQLKYCWQQLLSRYFGCAQVVLRFRTSYFPFTEPSIEVDLGCGGGGGGGLVLATDESRVERWLEVAGSGIIHRNVLVNMGIAPGEWSGFALGLGIERLAMLRHGIDDIRYFYDGDIRLLRAWGNAVSAA